MAYTEERVVELNGLRIVADVLIGINEELVIRSGLTVPVENVDGQSKNLFLFTKGDRDYSYDVAKKSLYTDVQEYDLQELSESGLSFQVGQPIEITEDTIVDSKGNINPFYHRLWTSTSHYRECIDQGRQEIFIGVTRVQYLDGDVWEEFDHNMGDLLKELTELRVQNKRLERENEVYQRRLETLGLGYESTEGETDGGTR